MTDFEGKGSKNIRQKGMKCPKCKSDKDVYYSGSSVTHGNPFTPAADTEVEHYYDCENCGHEWTVYA